MTSCVSESKSFSLSRSFAPRERDEEREAAESSAACTQCRKAEPVALIKPASQSSTKRIPRAHPTNVRLFVYMAISRVQCEKYRFSRATATSERKKKKQKKRGKEEGGKKRRSAKCAARRCLGISGLVRASRVTSFSCGSKAAVYKKLIILFFKLLAN
uniref:Uncharacterized protein n=1 Tax=Trichogramma kaykai TaxID=54128 RepID=A0ABD2X0I2_9HYME